ncbi:MAG TPA: T9SS type A sorting domain-containing protein, partial [Taishania sp.]|nr:T9SS type A sorting domain-containing protein [Taishania sp.]
SLDCHLSSASANYPVLADTLILDQGKLIANYDIYVRILLKLPSNVPHSIKNGRKIQLQPAYSGVSSYLPSCPGGGTLSTTGAKAELNGSCASSFYITGGTFENNSPYPLNVDYAVITDNTVTGSNTPGISTNSILSGVTTGWTGAAAQARKLHWVNSSATVGDTGDFYDGNNWEQLLPFYAAAPQCPPTVIDTVLFDNTSFSAANQVVQLTGTPDVASMYWENIPSGMSPKLSGLATTQMSIRASLHFHDNMVNNQLGPFLFRGIPTTDFPAFTIRGGTNKFLNKIEFLGDTDTTKWKLTDSLVQIYNNTFANTGYMYFKRGHIITNGKTVNVNGYLSTGVLKRHLDMTNSIVKTKFPWQISGTNVGNTTAEYTQTSDGSTVIINPPNTFFNEAFHIYFGGEKYNRVIANINCGNYGDLLSTNLTDSINYLEVNSINSKQYVGLKTVVKHAVFNNNIVLVTDRGVYDTLIFNNNATINTSNKYNNLLHFEPGRSYTLQQSTVQWVQNNAELELNGLSTATPIQFYGSPTGQQAYIRKDSGLVCADYVNIRDMWAIGNGNDAFGTCSPNNYCTHTNPWIPSSCDTIVDLLSSCGPWTINPADHNRGRADFNGGEYADFQGGNTFGWDKRAYPPAPLVSLTNLKDSICRMDSVAIQVSGVGTLPFIITWKENGVYHADTIYSAAELDSYNPTTSEFEIITWYYPMADISITDFAIKTERCLGSDSPVDNGVASITMLPCYLGVELLDFKATLKNTDVLLNWSTASELNNDYFELQYTHDGVNWEVVDKVKGKGTTHTLNNYSYVHYRPFGQSNTLYYRLKQVDFDGAFDYSPIRSVALNNGEGYVVYPNPATNVLYVSGKGAFNYQMLDASGKVVAEGASSGQDEISLFQLNPGVYMLEITDDQGVKEIFKIVKI